MSDDKNIKGTAYHIRVKGSLDPKWADWFEGFVLTPQDEDQTLLHGTVPDQAALHGVLSKINSLGLPLLLVAQLDQFYRGKRCPLCGQVIASQKNHERKGVDKS